MYNELFAILQEGKNAAVAADGLAKRNVAEGTKTVHVRIHEGKVHYGRGEVTGMTSVRTKMTYASPARARREEMLEWERRLSIAG